ncbi:DUF1592 domain-containing protein [uncultured Gimesia sp.]|uniref:DUF1592 domain-containing protein n=1 Tax=uncultured Gimesia sp. TaxID=1678688 RepID=UPI0030D846B1|tara:strand:- start:11839 stop:16098 length:4260 start_codon:yes stop_codon:yes gene_type:complete
MNDGLRLLLIPVLLVSASVYSPAEESTDLIQARFASLQTQFQTRQQAVLQKYCNQCHSASEKQGELDLARFQTVNQIRQDVVPWQRVMEMLDDGEMPPKDAKSQPTQTELQSLRSWVQSVLDTEAKANAGDPGPVVLRRLNNAEYTYTIQDLTGVSLQPAKEFPVDSAAGEGFTNVGNSLVMSPALVQKYLEAAKGIAKHAVLLPDGIEFSNQTSRQDWTNEKLAAIRKFYARFTESHSGTAVNLQGIRFETNGGGGLPLEKYLRATLLEREALQSGKKTISDVARELSLNEKYLRTLWTSLNDTAPSRVLDLIRAQWKTATPDDVSALVTAIAQWQQALWRLTTVGHIGKRNGPVAWQVPVQPVATQQEFRIKIPAGKVKEDLSLYLVTSTAGDGNKDDFAVWEKARFVASGQPDLPLRDVRKVVSVLSTYRDKLLENTAASLNAAIEAGESTDERQLDLLAQKHGMDRVVLKAWLSYLGMHQQPVRIDSYITGKIERAQNYDFIQGWVGENALSVVGNSSDQSARIPGEVQPHSIAVHPTPKLRVAVGWKSPIAGAVTVTGHVKRAHIGCGNGVTWRLVLHRGGTRQLLASGTADSAKAAALGPFKKLVVRQGDLLSLSIGPRDGNHSCDLTAIDLTILSESNSKAKWNLAKDVSPKILEGNPHPDQQGNQAVWHFYSEPDDGKSEASIPVGSLLARWQVAPSVELKKQLANQLQSLISKGPGDLPADSPDVKLYRQLTSLNGPFFSSVREQLLTDPQAAAVSDSTSKYGLDPSLFGKHPLGLTIPPSDLCVQAPSMLELVIPADLVEGYEFVVTGRLHAKTSSQGTVQLKVMQDKPEQLASLTAGSIKRAGRKSTWSDGEKAVIPVSPILVSENSKVKQLVLAQFDEFRQLFPVALCYTKIVPVDEVVTLTLFYREDDHLQRLMLNEDQVAELNKLWNDLHYVSRSPLIQVDAYEQLWQFATQDADPSAFTPMRKGILQRANEFKTLQLKTEPVHVNAVLDFAEQAWRRPLLSVEREQLSALYNHFRELDLSHEEAVQMLLARVLVSPTFLYRSEQVSPGTKPTSISDWELASRLSYFLWSSLPDLELRSLAAQNKLHQPEILQAQVLRMLHDPKMRRMAIEFGCQWLHIRDFDQFDEKSQRHFPEFKDLRSDMYEEVIRFFTNMFQQDRSVMEILDADYTFVNERLAGFYGLSGMKQKKKWERIEGVKKQSRGGILAMAATLSKQSGASRTSPILRGNWVSEFLLGEKLPRPPKDVPVLPEEVPKNLTERQLIEQHSSNPGCAKCHQRIDGFGFTLEQFDSIGRLRTKDTGGHKINVSSVLPDGTKVSGVDGLRDYLLTTRRDDFLRTFHRRLLGYSLGRSVQLSDEPLLDDVLQKMTENEYRISTAIQTIVLSPQFRMIRGADQKYLSSISGTE